jgi:hypothetical protein
MASYPTRQHVNIASLGFRRCVSQKVGYATKELALDAAERQMASGKVNPGCHICPYVCLECGEWHCANRVLVNVRSLDES